jgi:hypothetical protein
LEEASKVQDGTHRPTESTVEKAERARENIAQASTGREAFSDPCLSDDEPGEKASPLSGSKKKKITPALTGGRKVGTGRGW